MDIFWHYLSAKLNLSQTILRFCHLCPLHKPESSHGGQNFSFNSDEQQRQSPIYIIYLRSWLLFSTSKFRPSFNSYLLKGKPIKSEIQIKADNFLYNSILLIANTCWLQLDIISLRYITHWHSEFSFWQVAKVLILHFRRKSKGTKNACEKIAWISLTGKKNPPSSTEEKANLCNY